MRIVQLQITVMVVLAAEPLTSYTPGLGLPIIHSVLPVD